MSTTGGAGMKSSTENKVKLTLQQTAETKAATSDKASVVGN